MATLTKKRVRIKLDQDLGIPFALSNVLTGDNAETWQANATDIEIAVFNTDAIASVSDLTSINCKIQPSQIKGEILADSTVAAINLDDTTTAATWADGTKQHALFSFDNSEMNLTIPGSVQEFWIVFTGLTTAGDEVTLGAGKFFIHQDNNEAGDPPAENPGTCLTVDEADARYTGIAHESDTANPHSVTKAQVGLTSVDDTSDADKPVSTAQQTALDLKADALDYIYLILAGQSNAVGWDAGTVGISETPTANIQIWNSIAGTPAWENFDLDAKTTQFNTRYGGGPAPVDGTENFAWAAAQQILESTGRPVRVIVEVEGDQAIDQWVPDTTDHWVNLEAQIAAAAMPRLDMFMWHQGEGDRSSTRDDFRDDVEGLITQIKALSCFDERSLIAIGELSEPGRTDVSTIPFTGFQNFILRDVVRKANDPFLQLIKCGKGKQKSGDIVHFDAEGLVAGGKLFANALLGASTPPDTYELGRYNPLWDFDAQEGVQYTLAAGTRTITSWNDRTAGLEATLNTGSPVLVNDELGVSGQLVAMGNGGQFQFYPQAQAQTFWIAALAVVKSTDVASKNSVILDGNGSSRILIFSGGSSGSGELKYSAGTTVTGAVPSTDVPILVTVNFDGASSESFVDGVSDIAGNANTNGFDGTGLYYIGNTNDAGSDSNIRIVRVAAFAGVSTAAKRAEVESIMRREAGA